MRGNAAPGWYPDPSGGPGRKYWDGAVWHDAVPAEPKPTRQISTKALLIAAAIFVAVVVVGNILETRHEDTKQASKAASSSAAATASARPALPADATFHTEQGPNGEIVFAEFTVHDNFTAGLRRTGAQTDTLEILEYAHTHYPAAARVWVQGRFPLTDDYGNTRDGAVLNVGYDRATLDRINWENMDYTKIWDIADAGTVHKDLR